MERRVQQARSERLERTKASVAQRLKPVCEEYPDMEFAQLVERIAEVEIKYLLRAEKAFGGS